MMAPRLEKVTLPQYTRGEERLNVCSHLVGVVLGICILRDSLALSHRGGDPFAVAASWIYGLSMILLYAMSSLYHALPSGNARKLMRIVDHCTIYLLIAGTYTPILSAAVRPLHPRLARAVLGSEWGLGLLSAVFTAIDLKKYSRLSMACYIAMGWLVLVALRATIEAVTLTGFWWLLAGGVAYTLGAVLYGAGKKRRWFHGVFHIFVLLGSILQAVCILRYAL